jgi:hypothetical protein
MKKILLGIFCLLGLVASAQENSSSATSQFIFVKIYEQIMPIDRGKKYEDPLDAALKAKNIGEVSGGGTMLSKPDKEGNKTIEYVGVDVDLSDFDRGLPILKSELISLGVPAGTLLEYTRNGVKHSEPVK